jgi:hypothetical protein
MADVNLDEVMRRIDRERAKSRGMTDEMIIAALADDYSREIVELALSWKRQAEAIGAERTRTPTSGPARPGPRQEGSTGRPAPGDYGPEADRPGPGRGYGPYRPGPGGGYGPGAGRPGPR